MFFSRHTIRPASTVAVAGILAVTQNIIRNEGFQGVGDGDASEIGDKALPPLGAPG